MKNHYPKISVVTPSFNQGAFIENAGQLVLQQDYPNIEYIIIDGGSSDNTVEIIKKYTSEISYWCSEPDKGAAEALNKGFERATGDWYFYLNSDDLLLPGAIGRAVNFLHRKPGFDVYYGHGFLLDQKSRTKRAIYSDRWELYGYYMGEVLILQQSTFIRSAAFEAAGGFNENNLTCWDGELLVDIELSGGSFSRMNDFFGVFRWHSQSISGSQKRKIEHRRNKERIDEKIRSKIHFDRHSSRLSLRLRKLIQDPFVTAGRIRSKLFSLHYLK